MSSFSYIFTNKLKRIGAMYLLLWLVTYYLPMFLYWSGFFILVQSKITVHIMLLLSLSIPLTSWWITHRCSMQQLLRKCYFQSGIQSIQGFWLYFVSSRERPWRRHWSRPRIHAARRILYASICVPFWTREKTHKLRAQWQALTSRSLSRWDKVYRDWQWSKNKTHVSVLTNVISRTAYTSVV